MALGRQITDWRIALWGLVSVGLLLGSGMLAPARAASDVVEGYAWGENLGWLNFGARDSHVQVTTTAVTGFAWSSTFGWVNLGPFQNASGVTNTPAGQLGGFAWSDQLGWINMSGVQIGQTGVFTGIANVNGTRAGRINFTCTRCRVTTTWRPASDTSSTSNLVTTGTSAIPPPSPAQAVTTAPPKPAAPVAAAPRAAGSAPSTLFDIAVKPVLGSRWSWLWLWILLLALLLFVCWFLVWFTRRHQRLQRRAAHRRLAQKAISA